MLDPGCLMLVEKGRQEAVAMAIEMTVAVGNEKRVGSGQEAVKDDWQLTVTVGRFFTSHESRISNFWSRLSTVLGSRFSQDSRIPSL
ncbi:MAG: hypothetical protein AMJ92_07945 [candidate division Zixibacteria bacterium SM23_81]|nr:MAG: hypothetical protein AMJ92_07945 [candidate division Zixibacteria bacterium SM23_81]